MPRLQPPQFFVPRRFVAPPPVHPRGTRGGLQDVAGGARSASVSELLALDRECKKPADKTRREREPQER